MRNIKEQLRQAEEIIKKHPRLNLYSNEITALMDSFEEDTKKRGIGNSIYKSWSVMPITWALPLDIVKEGRKEVKKYNIPVAGLSSDGLFF